MRTPRVDDAPLADIPPATLYGILQLRSDVFVVEQSCACAELDGRDLEPAARLLWVARDGVVVATGRLLEEPDGALRIGRVATATAERGNGLGAAVVRRAIELAAGREVVLAAQTHLAGWYGGLGFVRDGPDGVEAGIPHTPMRLASIPATP